MLMARTAKSRVCLRLTQYFVGLNNVFGWDVWYIYSVAVYKQLLLYNEWAIRIRSNLQNTPFHSWICLKKCHIKTICTLTSAGLITGWASEASNIILLRDETGIATKRLDRFKQNLAHKFFGAKCRSRSLMGKIALNVSTCLKFKCFKNDMCWTAHYFWKQITTNRNLVKDCTILIILVSFIN